MRALLVHNFYREPGGEDYAFHADATALERRGHTVATFQRSSGEATDTRWGVLKTALATPWATQTSAELGRTVSGFRPDIVHFHNTFPLISPAAYYVVARANLPVVQTLHNYRVLCPKADLFRDGHVCEDCVARTFPSPAIRRRCYRGSYLGTAAVSGMLALHRALHTWERTVDRYFALTDFARNKFVEGGLPAERIRVKPNFLVDKPPVRSGVGEHALFVGRLTVEKGVRTLMHAWAHLDIPLHIVGSGPLEKEVHEWAASRSHVRVLGQVARTSARAELATARFLVFPSLWYEGMPIAILEALAAGVPVLASAHGSLREIVNDISGGLPFDVGDVDALVSGARELWDNLARNGAMSLRARQVFDERYDATTGGETLARHYEEVVRGRRQ